MTNRWQLYSSMRGWALAEETLNKALELAISNMEAKIHEGLTIPVAVRKAFTEVNQVMQSPEVCKFGGEDTEPRGFLADHLEQHIWRRYKVHCYVNSCGDVNTSNQTITTWRI